MADKYLYNNAGQITEKAAIQASTGATDAGKIPALDANGKIDQTMMPTGMGADVQILPATEALAAGDFVNVWDNAGVASVRKADATVAGKEAHGFVLGAFASGASATVYFEGTNNAVTGQTAGPVFLSATAGQAVSAAPSGSGNVVQRIGFATSATTINFQSQTPIVLA